MTLEIRTEYDIPHLEELQRVLSIAVNPEIAKSTQKRNKTLGMVLLCACVLMLIAIEKLSFFALGLGAAGIFLLDQGRRYFLHNAKKIRKSMSPVFTGNDYIVDELGIRIDNALNSSEYGYGAVERMLETTGNIYVMLNDGQGLILDKSRVSGGSVEDLRSCLQDNSGKQMEYIDLLEKSKKK